jgi:hypothetical protein
MNMNRRFRLPVARFVVDLMWCQVCLLWLLSRALSLPVHFWSMIHKTVRTLRWWNFKRRTSNLHKRSDAVIQRIKSSVPSSKEHSACLAARNLLLQDIEHLRCAILDLRKPRPLFGAVVLRGVAEHLHWKCVALNSRSDAFMCILNEIEGDKYYWDLALWFVIPARRIENALGDLHEKYTLQSTTDGESIATAEYHQDVIDSVKDWCWDRFERWTALGTLGDLLLRWLKWW